MHFSWERSPFFLTQSFFYSCCGAYCIPGLKTDRARKSYFVHATRQFVSWHLTIMESALLNCPRKTLKTSYLAKIHDMSTTNELTLFLYTLYCAALQIHSIWKLKGFEFIKRKSLAFWQFLLGHHPHLKLAFQCIDDISHSRISKNLNRLVPISLQFAYYVLPIFWQIINSFSC